MYTIALSVHVTGIARFVFATTITQYCHNFFLCTKSIMFVGCRREVLVWRCCCSTGHIWLRFESPSLQRFAARKNLKNNWRIEGQTHSGHDGPIPNLLFCDCELSRWEKPIYYLLLVYIRFIFSWLKLHCLFITLLINIPYYKKLGWRLQVGPKLTAKPS